MRDRPAFDLFLISWLILFLELACIRWFPGHVLFLTFFTNTVLLASFIGMCVGCMLADRSANLIERTPIWLSMALVAGACVQLFQSRFEHYVNVGSQANPDVVYFGAEANAFLDLEFRIPVEAVMAVFFLLIGLIFTGPGQEMGRAFNLVNGRNRAYSVNLLGSLLGIISFAACSYLQLPPLVWFAASAAGLFYFLRQKAPATARSQLPFLIFLVLIVIPTSGFFPSLLGKEIIWSPYYRIDYVPKDRQVVTNLIGHQTIEPRERPSIEPYALPYALQRDVKNPNGSQAWKPFKRVLIIGAGSGNDLSRCLEWCSPDAKIDAVEIDPVIQSIGVKDHPNKPYADKRITPYINDGRNFLRRAPAAEYDLVIFALIDSLVLQSGYASLRLESYLFTTDALKDIRRVLKPTGVATIYNFFRQGWIVARLRDEAKEAFGVEPVIITSPPLDEIRLQTFDKGFTVLFAGSDEVIRPLREAFARSNNSYWFPWAVSVPPSIPAHFTAEQPKDIPAFSTGDEVKASLFNEKFKPGWRRFRIAHIEESDASLRPATDDWPFFYTRNPSIPGVTVRGMALVAVLSLVLWLGVAWATSMPKSTVQVSAEASKPSEIGLAARSFLLGAGFMLVETKAVVHMALLFGSTWMVNTVVFAAVLLMSLAGNLFAGYVKPKNLIPYYIGLVIALGLNIAIPLDAFLGFDRTLQIIGSCALVFSPVAFAGVIFASTFGRSQRPNRIFGSNVLGAMVGGLSENFSVVLGFRYLLCVAAGYYILSALFGNRKLAIQDAKQEV